MCDVSYMQSIRITMGSVIQSCLSKKGDIIGIIESAEDVPEGFLRVSTKSNDNTK